MTEISKIINEEIRELKKELLDEKPVVIGDKAFRVISVDPIEGTPADEFKRIIDKVNSEKPSGIKKYTFWRTYKSFERPDEEGQVFFVKLEDLRKVIDEMLKELDKDSKKDGWYKSDYYNGFKQSLLNLKQKIFGEEKC